MPREGFSAKVTQQGEVTHEPGTLQAEGIANAKPRGENIPSKISELLVQLEQRESGDKMGR